MLNKKDRTMDAYMRAGAVARLTKSIMARLWTDLGSLIPAPELNRLKGAIDKIDLVISNTENCMLRDHPKLSNDYLSIFYGDVGAEPKNDVDKQINEIVQAIVNELVWRESAE